MNKTIPFTSLKLLNRPIVVSEVNEDNIEGAAGDCLARWQKIRVCEGIPIDSKKHVLIHEAMHFYDDTLGLGLKHVQCDSLAFVFIDMIQNNPELVEYLMKVNYEL